MMKRKSSFAIIAALMIFTLIGCSNGFHPLGRLGFNFHDPLFQKSYDDAVTTHESQAESGKIKWTEAAQKIRDADKYLAENKGQYDTSWKYDSDDEEYHAFCIALAEKVDLGKVSVKEYRAARTAKMNQISYRRQTLVAQQQQANALRSTAPQPLQFPINRQITCETLGTTTTCR